MTFKQFDGYGEAETSFSVRDYDDMQPVLECITKKNEGVEMEMIVTLPPKAKEE